MATFSLEDAKTIGAEIGIDWDTSPFPPKELLSGMEVELEHGSKLGEQVNVSNDDPAVTAKIAWAHLMESPLYYQALAQMEKALEAAREAKAKQAATWDEKAQTEMYLKALEHVTSATEVLNELLFGLSPGTPDYKNADKAGHNAVMLMSFLSDLAYRDKPVRANVVDAVLGRKLLEEHPPRRKTALLPTTEIKKAYDDAAQHAEAAVGILAHLSAHVGKQDHNNAKKAGTQAFNLLHLLKSLATVERTAVIRDCKKKDFDPDRPASEQRVCLYTKDGKRLLGRHPDEESARKQEVAIKARGGSTKRTAIFPPRKHTLTEKEVPAAKAHLKKWKGDRISDWEVGKPLKVKDDPGTWLLYDVNAESEAPGGETLVLISDDFSTIYDGVLTTMLVNYKESAKRRTAAAKFKRALAEGHVPPVVQYKGKTFVPDLSDPETRQRFFASVARKQRKAAPELGSEYFIPVSADEVPVEVLSWYYRGQGDPLYAVVSRLSAYGETKASYEELGYMIEALEEFLDTTPENEEDEEAREEYEVWAMEALDLLKRLYEENEEVAVDPTQLGRQGLKDRMDLDSIVVDFTGEQYIGVYFLGREVLRTHNPDKAMAEALDLKKLHKGLDLFKVDEQYRIHLLDENGNILFSWKADYTPLKG